MNKPYRVMIVDDDKSMRESLEHLLENAGFETVCFSKAENIPSRLQAQDTDVLLCDVRMPGMSGTDLQIELKGQSKVPVVLMSAHGDITMAVSAIHEGAYSFLEKPFDPRHLIKLLENASQLRRLTRNAERLKNRLSSLSGLDRVLIGNSASLEKLRSEIIDLSSTDANVMLLGETGTGKELIAKALHDLGRRSAEPFVPLNCAAVPLAKFEEILFGIADTNSGLLEKSEGGTLFIDELGVIPPEMQAKLLRVIETRQYTPINSSKIETANIRIVSAGQSDLEDMVKRGDFREDLFYRLNTIMLNMSPLRDRKDDIVPLFMHYLQVFASTYEAETPSLSSGDIATLLAHDWPGNVRELRNACERHIIAARHGAGSIDGALRDGKESLDTPETLREAVASFERQLIGKALKKNEGRMDDVATVLGIGRRTLNEKIVKLNLDKEDYLSS